MTATTMTAVNPGDPTKSGSPYEREEGEEGERDGGRKEGVRCTRKWTLDIYT